MPASCPFYGNILRGFQDLLHDNFTTESRQLCRWKAADDPGLAGFPSSLRVNHLDRAPQTVWYIGLREPASELRVPGFSGS
jgi:hypothetical protein